MIDPADAIRRRDLYAERHDIAMTPEDIGHGHDGIVWQSDRDTAVKVCYRQESFVHEVECYERLRDRGVRKIKGFAVPELVDYDRQLWVIEMNIVAAPYILDFGKARVDYRHDFSNEVMADLDAQIVEWWGEEYAPTIRSIVRILGAYGIYYPDPRYGNITPLNWTPRE